MLEGEPGIGKSSLLKVMKKKLEGTHSMSYMDCTTLDLGDIAMPRVEREGKYFVTHYAPNARFMLQHEKPVVIMLDEITKAPEPVKNMLLPLIQERRLGDVPLPEGSIVFATGNLSTDGVGDNLKAHARNRVSMVRIQKPRAFQSRDDGETVMGEWGEWAINNDIAPEIITWTKDFPQAFASYTDEAQGDNPYIYHPNKQQQAFVSGRSLERASYIVKARKNNGPDVTIAALAGTIGEAAARDLVAYTTLADKLPGFDEIVKAPERTPVPSDPAALCMIVFNMVMNCNKANFDNVMKYVVRMKKETQALFAISVIKAEGKQTIAMTNRSFTKFAMENPYLFS
jgi:hypothetical protein